MGKHLAIDETSLSHSELYTILTNKKAKGKKGSIVAVLQGTKAEYIISILSRIPLKQHNKVKEITLCMTANMQSFNAKIKSFRSKFRGCTMCRILPLQAN